MSDIGEDEACEGGATSIANAIDDEDGGDGAFDVFFEMLPAGCIPATFTKPGFKLHGTEAEQDGFGERAEKGASDREKECDCDE